jgi:hypothetical protein
LVETDGGLADEVCSLIIVEDADLERLIIGRVSNWKT